MRLNNEKKHDVLSMSDGASHGQDAMKLQLVEQMLLSVRHTGASAALVHRCG